MSGADGARMTDKPVRIGVDIGGTFTDVLLFDAERRRFRIAKVLTTPDDPSRAVENAVPRSSAAPTDRVVMCGRSSTERRWLRTR